MMYRFWQICIISIFTVCLGCQTSRFRAQDYQQLNEKYDVVIRRDIRGVPHVLGETDADTAFGFAYAQAEDHWELLERYMPFYRGEAAIREGIDGAAVDYLVKWLELRETLDDKYASDLSPQTRAFVQAFADGFNFYGAKHPDLVDESIFPITPQDVVMGFMLRHLLFYGFENTVIEVNKPTRQRDISKKNTTVSQNFNNREVIISGLPIGSNAFAISPKYSTEGATRIAINSHQPLTGPVAWYEAHLQSKTGLNVMGGLFPGQPMVSVGFTENLAWGATVNNPDLVDVYVLTINPDDKNQYLVDGEWKELRRRKIHLTVKLLGFLPWPVTREGLYSIHGPVMRTKHGTYAIRYAGMGEIRQIEQWYRMNRATNFDQWYDAMSMMSFASFNFVYADKTGNIMFVHNSLTPKRDPNYDWQQYLPGDDSALIWTDTLPFAQLPKVVNPSSGYIHSANQTPFAVSAEQDNPKPEDFEPSHGFQTVMTNRAHRGLELFRELGPLSKQQFIDIKHDKFYSKSTSYVAYLDKIARTTFTEPLLIEAQKVLVDWDLGTDIENRGAALGTCVLIASERDQHRDSHTNGQVTALLHKCASQLYKATGSLTPKWGEVNRHIRGELNLPVGGGPDVLRAVYGTGLEENGYLTNVSGDGLYYVVSWESDGSMNVLGVHPFGSATLDEKSPHFADQAQDYVDEVMHDPLFLDQMLQGNIALEYRPGERE